jgi:hypothetical protein
MVNSGTQRAYHLELYLSTDVARKPAVPHGITLCALIRTHRSPEKLFEK